MRMKLAEHEVTLKGGLESAWAKLVDWKSMPEWDTFMKSVEFDGPLKTGSVGKLVLKNGQQFVLRVTSFTFMKEYTDEFSCLGSRFIFYHELIPQALNEVKMRLAMEAEGLVAFLLWGLLSKSFRDNLPGLMCRFKTQFEEQERNSLDAIR